MTQVTACTMDCPDACSLLLSSDAEGNIHVQGNPDNPFTSGFICPKIKDHIKRLQNPQRILRPMLKSDKGWQTISWEVALDLCAEKIQKLRQEPAAILHINSDGAKGVLKEATTLFFAMLGASRIRGSLCDAAGYMAYVHDFGSRYSNDINDLLNTANIINWGKDLSRSSIHTAAIVKQARKKGAKVLSISPGDNGNQPFSDVLVRIRPGTDRFLAAAVTRLFVERDLISSDILNRTRNPDKFFAVIMNHPSERLADTCDVSPDEVEQIFQFYATPKPAATLVGTGVQRYKYGGENLRFINALALVSGNIGRSGGGSYYQLHSYRNLNLDWTKDPEKKPRRSFQIPTVGKEILAAKDPPVKMIWVNGINVINQAPDSHQIIRAFEKADFKVVVDAYMNDTAQRADLILPSTLMLEQEDIIGSFLHEYVQYVSAVLRAPEETRNDLWILTEVGKRLDPPLILPDAESCFRAALKVPYLDTSLKELRQQKCVRSNRPKIAYAELKFDHQDGKYRFPTTLHQEPPPPPNYPLRLLSLVSREAIHSQILPEKQKQPPKVWVAPDSPAMEHLDLKKNVNLVSPLGRLKVSLQTLPGLHPDVVIYRRGDWMSQGGGVNQLIAAALTDIGSGAAFYDQYVRLENI